MLIYLIYNFESFIIYNIPEIWNSQVSFLTLKLRTVPNVEMYDILMPLKLLEIEYCSLVTKNYNIDKTADYIS